MSINAWIGIFVQRWISEKIEIFSTLMMINELYWYVYISIFDSQQLVTSLWKENYANTLAWYAWPRNCSFVYEILRACTTCVSNMSIVKKATLRELKILSIHLIRYERWSFITFAVRKITFFEIEYVNRVCFHQKLGSYHANRSAFHFS